MESLFFIISILLCIGIFAFIGYLAWVFVHNIGGGGNRSQLFYIIELLEKIEKNTRKDNQ